MRSSVPCYEYRFGVDLYRMRGLLSHRIGKGRILFNTEVRQDRYPVGLNADHKRQPMGSISETK